MIVLFENFVNEKGKFKTVDYKIIITDLKDEPKTLITDFEIIKIESGKSVIKAKGYTKDFIDNMKKKKVWIDFDDFKDDKTRTISNKQFKNGTKKIKVYA